MNVEPGPGPGQLCLQDKRVEQQCIDETSKPSLKVMDQHAVVAATAWEEFEEDEGGLVSFPSLKTSAFSHIDGTNSGAGAGVSGKGGKKPQPPLKPSAKSKVSPNVEAARQRARTASEWKRVEVLLEKALSQGHAVLTHDSVVAHGSQEAAEQDCSLNLLRDRMNLIRLATNKDDGAESKTKSQELYQLCLQDPYLKDLSSTLLAVEEGVQTVGAAVRCRDTLLDLQPSAARVIEIMDNHRNGIALLKTIATCVQTEADGWKANIQALLKAKADEQKALEKAAEKEKKKEEQQKKRAEAALQRKKEAERRKLAKQQEQEQQQPGPLGDGHAEEQPVDDNPKTRRSRMSKGIELSEADPMVLRELRSSSLIPATARLEQLSTFINTIAINSEVPAVARLRKAAFKKCLSVT